MSEPIRLLVCDIDGTFVRHDKSLSDAVRAAGLRLVAAGVALSFISSRPPSGMRWLAEIFAIPGPLAAFNGGTLFRPDGGIVSAWRVPEAVGASVLPLASGPKLSLWAFARGQWFVTNPGNPHVVRERIASRQEPVVRTDFSDLLPVIDKIVIVSGDGAALDAVEAAVEAVVAGQATITRSQPYYLDITHRRANKGDGVAALAEAIGVPLGATAVIGDMTNDMAMFARAGLSIAMGQAPEAVRAAADHVTTSNEEDGVARAIDTIILPRAFRL